MSKVLYHERKDWQDDRRKTVNWIDVEVRSWSDDDMCPDIVIHSRVSILGERVVDKREVLSHADSDAAFIRMGIDAFDCLVAAYYKP